MIFPENIVINATQKESFTNITLQTKSVIFDTEVYQSFKIPSGYKELKF